MSNNDNTVTEFKKCSIRMEGSSTKSVAHRVPETFWYSVLPIIAVTEWLDETMNCCHKLLTVHGMTHFMKQSQNFMPF